MSVICNFPRNSQYVPKHAKGQSMCVTGYIESIRFAHSIRYRCIKGGRSRLTVNAVVNSGLLWRRARRGAGPHPHGPLWTRDVAELSRFRSGLQRRRRAR